MESFVFCFCSSNTSNSSYFFNFILFSCYFLNFIPNCIVPHRIKVKLVLAHQT